jgi:hypothetical protein
MRKYKWLPALLILVPLCGYASDPSGAKSPARPSATEAVFYVTTVTNGQPVVTDEHWPESRFAGDIPRHWRTNYALFSKALVEAAERRHLDSASLAKVLQNLLTAPESKHWAMLPVCAWSTQFDFKNRRQNVWRAAEPKFDGEWVWVVELIFDDSDRAAEHGELGHIADFWISQRTLELVQWDRCY